MSVKELKSKKGPLRENRDKQPQEAAPTQRQKGRSGSYQNLETHSKDSAEPLGGAVPGWC